MSTTEENRYRPTESKYKGGASEMYVTYDLEQATRSGRSSRRPKVKRVYIAGEVTGWQEGEFRKKSGRRVHGVRVEYEQSRRRYRRHAYEATRGGKKHHVSESSVRAASQRFTQVLEVPDRAENVRFHTDLGSVSEEYRHALQRVR
jgi:hypothetical protein